MKKVNLFFILYLIGSLMFFGCSGGGSNNSTTELPPAQSTTKVLVSPASGNVSNGTTFTRTVEVQNIKNGFFTAFDLTYDPAIIEFVDATEGVLLNQNGAAQTFFQVALENGGQGRVVVGLTRLGQIGEVSGSGTLLTLSFKAVGTGTAILAFSNPKGFKSMSNQDLTIDAWENGTITVQ
ncbi:MAG TPA: cohesin domain-containing protein [Nitrospiria bacterium]|nr:cohesin domain-containing protein [Nitrospiria bacterium]